jgi:hypothetical protein
MKFGLVTSLIHHCVSLKRFFEELFQTRMFKMRRQTVDEYLIAIFTTYQAASREEKGNLLDHAELVTKRSRKQLIRRLNSLCGSSELKDKRPGRPLVYSREDLTPHIKFLWEQMERISCKRMKAAMKIWLPKYKDCPAHLKMQLHQMSATTLDRYLKGIRQSLAPSKGLPTTCPARHMKNRVPINTLDSKIKKPGYTQTDTVAHCGNSAAGPFISSLTVTDIWSAWTENRAMFTKRGTEVKKHFKDIEDGLPFKLLAINSDSGSEFLNKNMLQFTKHGTRVEFTRSRPYKKNDNCYVEQKNFTHVRELFGYERFEDQELVELMNEIYTRYWNPLQNHFLPTFKLKKKIRIGARIHKKYDTPMTPYQRLIECPHLTREEKDELMEQHYQLDPFELKKNLEIKLKEFFDLVRKKDIRKVA